MGKVIVLMNVSLDGYIETPDHSLDWAITDDELHTWFNERSPRAPGPRAWTNDVVHSAPTSGGYSFGGVPNRAKFIGR